MTTNWMNEWAQRVEWGQQPLASFSKRNATYPADALAGFEKRVARWF